MQPVLTDRDIKFVMDKRGRKKEVILSYKKFTEIQNILEKMLPDREYDLTEAVCEGVKEIGRVKKKKAFRNMRKL
ncbi:MAG: hypothetical protein U9R02_09590 [Thermodesulfobacteriota bacterium]|nr:hypothetical protein [Thermodesulfobacteriota bacterium]